MSNEPSSDRKRKAVQAPEVGSNSDGRTPKKSKFPRGSLDSMTLSPIDSLYGTTPMSTKRVARVNNASAFNPSIRRRSRRQTQLPLIETSEPHQDDDDDDDDYVDEGDLSSPTPPPPDSTVHAPTCRRTAVVEVSIRRKSRRQTELLSIETSEAQLDGANAHVGDLPGPSWEARLSQLADYRKIHGHCNVPKGYSENAQLANWVRTQRYQYKLHREGKASQMTLSRIQELESLGFEWDIHKSLSFVSRSVIDLTDDSAHPSPASVPVPPLATTHTLAEFKSMWITAEKNRGESTEEIEQGSLVRSGNSKVEVRGITDTCVWKRYIVCLVESVWIGYCTVHSLTTVALRFMHSFLLDPRQCSSEEGPIRSHLV
jgi:hypothetical protein